jgi:BirA family biotin operon repressor/biotin-[acetyl-CoA-carboxylase] ligase
MPQRSVDLFDPVALVRAGVVAGVEHLPETGSTMDAARLVAADRATPLPLLVIADRQVQGRGRRGAGWWQAPGSLAMSLVVDAHRVTGHGPPPATWSLACGVALAEAIRALVPGVEALVRWPNDVEVPGRKKLAGILVETAPEGRVIFGIGVNTTGTAADAPEAIRHRVATMPDISGRPLPRQDLLAAFIPRLLALITAMDREPTMLPDRYRPLCCVVGTSVTIHVDHTRHTGLCRGITDDGRLVLDAPQGLMFFRSGSLTPPDDVWPGGGVSSP